MFKEIIRLWINTYPCCFMLPDALKSGVPCTKCCQCHTVQYLPTSLSGLKKQESVLINCRFLINSLETHPSSNAPCRYDFIADIVAGIGVTFLLKGFIYLRRTFVKQQMVHKIQMINQWLDLDHGQGQQIIQYSQKTSTFNLDTLNMWIYLLGKWNMFSTSNIYLSETLVLVKD